MKTQPQLFKDLNREMRLVSTDINKHHDENTGLFFYRKIEKYTSKLDEQIIIHGTRLVEENISFQEAAARSDAFSQEEVLFKTHMLLGGAPDEFQDGSGNVYEYPDGSFYLSSFNKGRKCFPELSAQRDSVSQLNSQVSKALRDCESFLLPDAVLLLVLFLLTGWISNYYPKIALGLFILQALFFGFISIMLTKETLPLLGPIPKFNPDFRDDISKILKARAKAVSYCLLNNVLIIFSLSLLCIGYLIGH